jgi:hypothetical protein
VHHRSSRSVVPAPAGVARASSAWCASTVGRPRARGDGPRSVWGTTEPSYFPAQDIAVRCLFSAHPGEYERLLDEAKAELSAEPFAGCVYLGAAALELADLLGHDLQGHLVQSVLWSH